MRFTPAAMLLAALATLAALASGALAADPVPGWSDPEQINAAGPTQGPGAVTADDGTTWVYWQSFERGTYTVPVARRFDPATGWSAVEIINDTAPDGIGGLFFVRARSGGGATAIWMQGGPSPSLRYADYAPSSGWGPARTINAPNTTVVSYVPSTASGDGLAAAWYDAGAPRSLWASVHGPSGFSPPTLMESNDIASVLSRTIRSTPDGGATVVFRQAGADGYNYLWFNDYSPTSGWFGPRRLDWNDTENVSIAVLNMAPDGFQVAFWHQSSNGTSLWRFSTRNSGNPWAPPQPLPAAIAAYGLPNMKFAPGGFALASWIWNNPVDGLDHVLVGRYDRATGWTTPQDSGAPGSLDYETSYMGFYFDDESNGYLVWSERAGANYSNWAVRFLNGSGWQPAFELAGPAGADALYPFIAPYGPRLAIFGWVEYGSTATAFKAKWLMGDYGWSAETVLFAAAPGELEDYSPWIDATDAGEAVAAYGARVVSGYGVFVRLGHLITEPSFVTIDAPAEGARTSLTIVPVAGSTVPRSRVWVNGVEAAVGSDGRYFANVTLGEGTWRIHVTARDLFGAPASASVNVTVEDASKRLSQELAAAQAELDAASAELNATHADLAATQGALNATRDELERANASLAAESALLAATRDELGRANESLAAQDAEAAARADAAARDIAQLQGQASTNLLLAVVALAVGAAGMALSFVRKRPPK